MAGGITFRIDGLKELDEGLKRLQGRVATQVARKALRAAANIILEDARARVPVVTGALHTSLHIKAGRKAAHFVSELVVAGLGWFQGKTFYGGFIEFGRSKVSRKTRKLLAAASMGKRGGREAAAVLHEAEFGSLRVPAKPFLRPAFDYQKTAALFTITGVLREELEKKL